MDRKTIKKVVGQAILAKYGYGEGETMNYYFTVYKKKRLSDFSQTTEYNQFGTTHPLIWQQEMNSQNTKEQIVILWHTEVDKWIANKIIAEID